MHLQLHELQTSHNSTDEMHLASMNAVKLINFHNSHDHTTLLRSKVKFNINNIHFTFGLIGSQGR